MDQSVRYEDDNSLRREVEKVAKVAVTDDEWSALVNDSHAPYDESDFTELVNAVRGFSVGRPKPSLDSRARDYRRSQGERSALEAKGMTEEFRVKLFGHKPPLFRHLIEAMEWIESHQEQRETKRLSIEATVPAKLSEEESLIWLGNYLAYQLGAQGLGRLLGNSDVLQDISLRMPILEYFVINSGGEIDREFLAAPDGTPLGELRSKGDQLAQFLKWEPCVAVHHLLTGGLVGSSGVQVETQIRTSRQVFGENNQMTLTITDPGSVTEKDLIAAF